MLFLQGMGKTKSGKKRKKTQNKKSKLKKNRKYKDSVFVDLHSKDELLKEQAVKDIYNALHDQKIGTEDKIRFIKLKSVFFHKVRNDVSFAVGDKIMVLLEHQSTINKNMAFRCLEYITALYASQMNAEDKFLPTPLQLMLPEIYTLYNGKASYPARNILPLSALFKVKTDDPQLELKVTVININHPDNQNFLDACPILKGYKKLVDKVEEYKILYGEDSYTNAIEDCIKENIEIADYLRRKTVEVMHMFSLEYNFNAELNAYKKAGKMEGRAEGRAEGRLQGFSEIVQTMKKKSFSVEDIANILDISKEKIEQLY